MINLKYFFFIFCVFLFGRSFASPNPIKFYGINQTLGLNLRETFSICKDGKGFVWTASKTGIVRVTEANYRMYKLPNYTADFVSIKLANNQNLIIAYTNTGAIYKYNELLDRFDSYLDVRKAMGNGQLLIQNVVMNQESNIWIAASDGLYQYDGKKLKLIEKQNYGVDFVAMYNNQAIFFATYQGLFEISQKNQVKALYKNNTFRYRVTAVYNDNESQKIWLGTSANGLLCFDEQTRQLQPINAVSLPKQPILAIAKSKANELLVGIDGQGIWSFDVTDNKVTDVYREDPTDPYSLKGDGVQDIMVDSDNKVWVATYSGGLSFSEDNTSFIKQIQFQPGNPNSLGNNSVNKILEDQNGNLWFATHNGLSCYKTINNQWSHYYKNKKNQSKLFIALAQDTQGNIWAGSFSSGVFVLNRNNGQELQAFNSSLNIPNFNLDDVLDIYTDNDGDIWLGGNQNLSCYLSKEKRFVNYSIKPVNSITELSKNQMLLSTSRGLLMMDKMTGKTRRVIDGYLTQDIAVVQNEVWVATSGNGLMKYNANNNSIERFTVKSGLPSDFVNSVVYRNGFIWIGTEQGLCRLNVKTNAINTYPSLRILSNTAFNVNAAILLKNGDLALGTNNGALIFDPEKIKETTPNGDIFLQDILVSGSSIRQDKELLKNTPVNLQKKLTLNYTQGNILLELLPVGTSGASTRFSWKLEGLDKEWTAPSENVNISYQHLSPGNFELKIRMYDITLSKLIKERSIKISVTPPFWATWWFRVLIIVAVLLAVLFISKIYKDRLQQQHAKEKLRFFTNTSHDIRTSLTLIKAPLEELEKAPELSEKSRYYLNLATEQSSNLSLVANQLLDLQKLDARKETIHLSSVDIVAFVKQRVQMAQATAEKNEITLDFSSDVVQYISAIDISKMEKVLDNLLSNAIKYSNRTGKVWIKLYTSPQSWKLDVQDNGIGIPQNEKLKLFREFYRAENAVNSKIIGSGIGLLLIKEYTEMHGGNVKYESKEGEGTTFTIALPHKVVHSNFENLTDLNAEYKFNGLLNDLSLSSSDDNIQKPVLLLVEDNESLQDFLKTAFSEKYTISVAPNGKKAWEMITQSQPDLIISDIMMPEMDGIQLCRLLKSSFETAHIPIILLTAISDKTKELEAFGLGADDYMTKPFDISLLQNKMASIIYNRSIVRSRALKIPVLPSDEKTTVADNTLNDEFVKNAIAVVRENMGNPNFGKDEFAVEMCVSSSLLYKKLKALTGLSPSDMIKSVRMDFAFKLLEARDLSVTEISQEIGFSSISTFSRAFKAHFGRAPTEV